MQHCTDDYGGSGVLINLLKPWTLVMLTLYLMPVLLVTF